ncbi:MAG: hypothetical protein RBU37_07770 [Myxococcota bacterium]|nr:hypothetical protein [Myxococcota bacterium]
MRRIGWGALLALVTAFVMPGQLLAEDGVRYREEIKSYSQRAIELTNHKQGDQLSTEMAQVKTWLDEALVQLGKENFDNVKILVQRARVQVEWGEVFIALLDKRAAANAREAELLEARQALSVAKAELQELENFEAQLQQTIASKSKQ